MSELQTEAERLVNEAAERAIDGVKVDLMTGRTVLLKDFEMYEGMLTAQYSRIATLEEKIFQWKVDNAGAKLPDEFFQLLDIEKMITWLT
jgi:hypothetical protein